MDQIIDKLLTKESSPGLRFWGLWTLVTLIGWGLGMVFSVPLNIILVSIIGPNAPTPWSITVKTLIIIFKGLEGAVTGLGMGLGQWLILRRFFKQASSSWIVATAIALATLAIVRWGFLFNISTTQSGILLELCYGVFLGVFQWLAIRKLIPYAQWWIIINIISGLAGLTSFVMSDFGYKQIEFIMNALSYIVYMILPIAVSGVGMVYLLRKRSN